jgi:hypothetical protein
MVRVLLELKHSHRTHMPLYPGPDTRIFRISRLRVTLRTLASNEVRTFLAIFIVVVLKIQMVFGSYIKRN